MFSVYPTFRYFVICHPFERVITIFRAKMIAMVLVVVVGVESLIATFSQDVWNDCEDVYLQVEAEEAEEEACQYVSTNRLRH